MMRNFVAFALLAIAGAVVLPEPVLAAGGARGGAMPAFRAPMMQAPRMMFRGGHPGFAPRAAIPPSPRAFGTVRPSTPFGTVKPSAPFGTVRASRPFGTVGPSGPRFGRATLSNPRSHLVRRNHRGYYFGWDFPVTYGDDAGYIGTPYDPAEAVPVYGPGPADDSADPAPQPPPPPRLSSAREQGGDGCRSERVTVPAKEGEREITVVRC